MTASAMLSKSATRWAEVMIHTKFVCCNLKHADRGVHKADGKLLSQIMEHDLLCIWGKKEGSASPKLVTAMTGFGCRLLV